MKKQSDKYWFIFICAVMTIVTLAVYWQMRQYDFISLDDFGYVRDNPNVRYGFSWANVGWAFSSGYASNWHPLTWLSHMLDCELYGTNAGMHHLTNLFLHIANVLLLFAVLRAMTGALWPSAFVAALFALHPLHVESVAWISERKDVLSTFFALLTMAAYLRYVKKPSIARYLPALLLFALGLMAKPMLVTLPFVLLLLDYWPLERFKPANMKTAKRLVFEKGPFFILSAASSIITIFVQKIITVNQLPLNLRIANTFISYVKYIEKMIWPVNLAIFYPHSDMKLSMPQAFACALLLLGISAGVICLARKRKYLLFGWLWYLGTLVPVIGLVQVGGLAMADRYTYMPLTGLFIIIAWGANDLLTGWKYKKIIHGISATMILLALAVWTFFQAGYWRNSLTLFEHAIAVTEDNYLAHKCLADALHGQDKNEEAIEHYRKAIEIGENYASAYVGLGSVLIDTGKTDQAEEYLAKAIQLDPESGKAYGELGRAMAKKGKMSEAAALFEKAARLEPYWIDPINALAWNLATYNDAKIRNPVRAVQLAKRACELTNYENPAIMDTMAAAYAAAGDFSKAIETCEKALALCKSAQQSELKREIENRLILYKAGKPYIEAQ
ncbi:MAG: tetratricopeptide repeat protein [Sedimentisphaerales bacterium]